MCLDVPGESPGGIDASYDEATATVLAVETTTPDQYPPSVLVLRSDDEVCVVIDASAGGPTILHWGADIGDDPRGIAGVVESPVPNGGLDVIAPMSITPEHGAGYLGRPGIEGHRPDGSDWAPRFGSVRVIPDGGAHTFESTDPLAGLNLRTVIEMRNSGVVRIQSTLTNEGQTEYQLNALRITVPLPARAHDTLTFAGRWTNEFLPERAPVAIGTLLVENRSGRTSHDRPPIAFVGTRSFTETTGEVWAAHLEWSGNASMSMQSPPDGRRCLQVEELLMPGEISLAPGEAYSTPWVCLAHSSNGSNGVSQRFHQELRNDPSAPTSPRPVMLNIWEAVYFNHELPTLLELADRSAQLGVERFVVDDGWFQGRRDDRAGLGDWWVDTAVWPDGLWPIVNHVVGLGMEFGLWFEPEMVNPDSDLYRAHPDWALADLRYDSVLGRHQLVLDVARPEVRAYLLEKISALLTEYPITYVKWDMNRAIVQGSSDGRASIHRQTVAVYALIDDLRAAHPTVEFETCASGGGRIDFGILRRTSRAWTSDCNDPLDRQRIQRGFGHVFPPEYMGAHIGGPVSHTTRRRHSLAFRAGTAFFGHLGIEWNVLNASSEDLAALERVIRIHKQFRPLLHAGVSVRLDHPNPAVVAAGVVRADRREALFSFALVETPASLIVEPLPLSGLDDELLYRVEVLPLVIEHAHPFPHQPAWFTQGVSVRGRVLRTLGLQPPLMDAESMILLHLQAE